MSFLNWFWKESPKTEVITSSPLLEKITKASKSLPDFAPAYLSKEGNFQTVAGSALRTSPPVNYEREILETPDGGEIVFDWMAHEQPNDTRPKNEADNLKTENQNMNAPIVICLHGLSGSSKSNYLRGFVNQLYKSTPSDWKCVVFHGRGTADAPLKTPKTFSAAFTDDFRQACGHLKEKYPKAPIYAIGFSLGSNIMTKYLGEEQEKSLVDFSISISNPFDLAKANENLTQTWRAYFYQPSLLKGLKDFVSR